MVDGHVDDFHPIDKNLRSGAAAYIKEAGAWTPWDGSNKNKVWDTVGLAWVSMTQPGGTGGGYETVWLKNIAGSQINPSEKLPLDGYELSDWTDEMTNPQYHGFLRADGAWAIKKMDASTNPRTIRWDAGASGYASAWTGRGSGTYDYFDAKF